MIARSVYSTTKNQVDRKQMHSFSLPNARITVRVPSNSNTLIARITVDVPIFVSTFVALIAMNHLVSNTPVTLIAMNILCCILVTTS